jgi:hypothetical protein
VGACAGRHDRRPVRSREIALPIEDGQDEGSSYRRSPTGPWVRPPAAPATEPRAPAATYAPVRRRRSIWSTALFALLITGIGIRAYRDLSRPEAWSYWKESYLSPTMTSSLIANADLDGSGRSLRVLAISGTIGAATAGWLRERLDEAHLASGEAVLLSSPGGNLEQAIIMGEIIRSRGLATAVGVADAALRITPSFCASACVLVYAGGKPRYGIDGSVLGVHRFITSLPGQDPVADAQRTTGSILRYLDRMGVSSAVVEAMSETREVRWLGLKEASAMNLITDPVRKP